MKQLWFLALALAPVCSPADLDPAKTEIHVDPESNQVSGEIVVDVPSGVSGSEARDRRMHQDILESQRYPEAAFTPDRVDGKLAPEGPSQIDMHGVFKIHGADHELTLHIQVDHTARVQYSASTHFVIPYVQWKVDKTVDVDIKTTINALN